MTTPYWCKYPSSRMSCRLTEYSGYRSSWSSSRSSGVTVSHAATTSTAAITPINPSCVCLRGTVTMRTSHSGDSTSLQRSR